jgi:hypothetical protein
MKLIIIASNSYHELAAYGIYKNRRIAKRAKEKYEEKHPGLDFLILNINQGRLVKSKENS